MEAGLLKKVWSVNRSWTPDSYFSLHKPIYRGEVRRKMFRGNVWIPQQGAQICCFVPGGRIPQLRHWPLHEIYGSGKFLMLL